jgi:hypothetical protein
LPKRPRPLNVIHGSARSAKFNRARGNSLLNSIGAKASHERLSPDPEAFVSRSPWYQDIPNGAGRDLDNERIKIGLRRQARNSTYRPCGQDGRRLRAGLRRAFRSPAETIMSKSKISAAMLGVSSVGLASTAKSSHCFFSLLKETYKPMISRDDTLFTKR